MNSMPTSLRNHFLIALPYMRDPNFAGTITYLCDHSEAGALGLIINRPMDVSLGQILAQLDLEGEELPEKVYNGGPAQLERGFVLHRPHGQWQHTLALTPTLSMTTSRDLLAAIGAGEGPEDYLVALGYAGWGAGQLEQELAGNVWLACPADEQIIFELPWQQRLPVALGRMGLDINQLSGHIGHA